MIPFALGLALTVVQIGEPATLADDPKLSEVLPRTERMIPVADLAQEFGQKLNVNLQISREVGDLKVALSIRAQTAGWTLDRVAEVLDLRWFKVAGGYALRQPAESLKRLRDEVAREEQGRRLALGRALDRLAALAKRPFMEIRDLKSQTETEIAVLRAEQKPGWTDRLPPLVRRLADCEEAMDLAKYALGRLLAANPALRARLLNLNQCVAGSEVPTEGATTVAFDLPSEGPPPPGRGGLVAAMRTGQEISVCLFYASGGPDFRRCEVLPLPDPTDASRVDEAIRKWGQSASEVRAKLGVAELSVEASPPWPRHRIQADAYLEAAERSKIDFVGDSFHVPMAEGPMAGADRASLWASLTGRSRGPFLRAEDGAVLLRHADFWSHRESEIPERILRPLQAASPADRPAFLLAASEFARSLNPAQVQCLGRLPYEGWGHHVATARVVLTPLRFWGWLSDEARSAALARNPIGGALLISRAREEMRFAILEGVLVGGFALSENPARLLLDALNGRLQDMAFLMESSQAPYAEISTGTRTFPIRLDRAPEGSKQAGVRIDTYFYFGRSAKDAVRFGTTSLIPLSGS